MNLRKINGSSKRKRTDSPFNFYIVAFKGKRPLSALFQFFSTVFINPDIYKSTQVRRRGGSRGSIEPPLEVNNGGLKTQTVDFQSAFSK